MSNTKLFELFPAEHRDLIQRYKSTLPRVFKQYDIAIFMARKAICFYKSLVIGEYIGKADNYDCQVYTNRILTYDVAKMLQGKRVVVIDDIVIKGESIHQTLNSLLKMGVKADVYILARQIDDENNLSNASIVETFAEVSKDDACQLSKHIANFIEASVCPYNVDQPIYEFSGINADFLNSFSIKYSLVDISSALQRKYEIQSLVLEICTDNIGNPVLRDCIELCKIRFLYGRYSNRPVLLAVPFVLLKEMGYELLDEVFACLGNQKINEFICKSNDATDSDKRVCYENKLKILHYVLSAQLMEAFLLKEGIKSYRRLDSNDNFAFAADILKMVSETDNRFTFTSTPANDEISFDFDFIQSDYLDISFDFLYSDNMLHLNYSNSDGKPIDSELLVLSELKTKIAESAKGEFNMLAFSNVIDILIDRGLIIPSIVHGTNATILRAYKCGEVYTLNDKHFKLFTYTLCEYLKGIGHDYLWKTEFEKLCVLFFRDAINHQILKYDEAQGHEDEYSICYSKFGPRVSTSKPIYAADATSTLASKLLNLKYIETEDVVIEGNLQEMVDDDYSKLTRGRDSFLVQNKYKTLEVNSGDIENPAWEHRANHFARKFKKLYTSLFDSADGEILFEDVRDMHMRSYIEFLIMLTIGLSKKDQLLSLLAEVYLFCTVDTEPMQFTNYGRILDGLISGMWKYMCYKQPVHPLLKLQDKLNSDNKTEVLGLLLDDILCGSADIDKNENIEPQIDEAGKLIFSITYSIWFIFKKYNIKYLVHDASVDLENRFKREFYYGNLRDLRKIIEEQIQSNTREQDVNTILGLREDARKLIEKYNSEIAGGKRQMKDKDTPVQHTEINFYGKTHIEGSAIGTTVQGDMNVTFTISDIEKIRALIAEVVKEAESKHLKEIDEILTKMDELQSEIISEKPNKNTIYKIVDWTQKIAAISVASINLYRFIAPLVGVPIA